MKAVILLAYEFPPLNVGGSQRPYRFARYLKDAGYYPIVITPQPELHGGRIDPYFQDSDISPEICRIVRTGLGVPRHGRLKRSGYLSIVGDEAKRWRDYCIENVLKISESYDVVAVITTVPPFSVAGLG
ncbi:hypothetical protein [Alcanivorax sp. 1008]|uniref:hypothetical protein n=1 Tax=Alcanivorax sp. 1008 TaxID=2816853 RepID=UPI001E1AC652|nr:hypothetical protein [Alcanivorax sp. 1008]MCC1498219.1 hypothetical protein [Alcanivorax sp. 1008]